MNIVGPLFDLLSWLPWWFIVCVVFAFVALVVIGLIRFIRWIVETIPGF